MQAPTPFVEHIIQWCDLVQYVHCDKMTIVKLYYALPKAYISAYSIAH